MDLPLTVLAKQSSRNNTFSLQLLDEIIEKLYYYYYQQEKNPFHRRLTTHQYHPYRPTHLLLQY